MFAVLERDSGLVVDMNFIDTLSVETPKAVREETLGWPV